MKVYGRIYQIKNNINGKTYIGKTTLSIKERFSSHARSKSRSLITRAIKKYGKSNFSVFEICQAESETELNKLEVKYIKELSPEYNLRSGGEGGKMLPEAVRRLRESHRPQFKTIVQTDLRGNFIAEYESSYIAMRETGINKSYIMQVCNGRHFQTNGFRFYIKGNSILAKKNKNDYKKPVIQTLSNGEEIEYYSASYAARDTGISRSKIVDVCRNIRKTAGGFFWRYS